MLLSSEEESARTYCPPVCWAICSSRLSLTLPKPMVWMVMPMAAASSTTLKSTLLCPSVISSITRLPAASSSASMPA